MVRVSPRESPFDAGSTVIGFPILVWHHTNDLIAFHFRFEGATYAAVPAGSKDGTIRNAVLNDGFFHQRSGGTGLNARTA